MKKITALILFTLLMAGHSFAADLRTQFNERMVGANHPTLSDTLNRRGDVEHNTDGTHKYLGSTSVRVLKDGDGLNAAITSAGTTTVTFRIVGTVTLSAAVTSPANISYIFESPGNITKVVGTLAINGSFSASPRQVFFGFSLGDVTFGTAAVKEIHPEWWGANTTPGTTDFYAPIQNAINSQTKPVVILPSERIRFDSAISMVAGMTMKGGGPGVTILESYVTGTSLDKPAGAVQGYGLHLQDFTLKNMGTGAVGFAIAKENFINFSRVEITADSASHPWTTAGITLYGDVTDQQYNHSFYDVDYSYCAIGLNLIGEWINEIGLFKGRFRLCPIGIKIDQTSGVKLYGVNFSALTTAYAGPTYDGIAVSIVNGGDVQSFGSRFENMDTAYLNDSSGGNNNIMAITDIVSQTSVDHVYWDGAANNYVGVVNVPRYASAGTTPLLVPLLRLFSVGANNITLENTAYDTIAIKNATSSTGTFKITNETSGVDYVTMNHFGTLASFSGEVLASELTASAAGAAVLNLTNSNYDDIQITSSTDSAGSFKVHNVTTSADILKVAHIGNAYTIGNPTYTRRQEWSDALVSSGTYTAGSILFKYNPTIVGTGSGQYTLLGRRRITTGSNHVLGTDWSEMRIPTENSTPLSGTTNTFGGALLTDGTCTTGTATVSGATVTMTAIAQPADGVKEDGLSVGTYISAVDTVLVSQCSITSGITPAARRYYIRVFK